MSKIKLFIAGVSLLASSSTLLAAEKVVTLDVEKMTCQTCPYQVKKSLTSVEGVIEATASFETQQAVVTFDDAVTNVTALTEATTNAGYPSKVSLK